MNESELYDCYETPIFEKAFSINNKSVIDIMENSLNNIEELKKFMDEKPFFKEKNDAKLNNFLIIASSCIDLSMFENGEFYIYTDEKDKAFFYIIAEKFSLSLPQMSMLGKICLFASDIEISATDEKDHCTISVGFDFSKDNASIFDFTNQASSFLNNKKD